MSENEEPIEIKQENPVIKKKREGIKMTDQQKAQLTKYMNKQTNLSVNEKRSLRMKIMTRQRKGMSINKALKDINSK
jgi:hypothetical protein